MVWTAVLAVLTTAPLPAADTARPNILLVVTDDQGYGDSSSYGATDLSTPVMDAIAARGVRFEKFRVNPLCAPTRASCLTGLYSLDSGMWRGPGADSQRPKPVTGWPPHVRRIRDDVVMLPQLLQTAGYVTGIFGKWHLGYDDVNVPTARGFDEFVGFLGGAHPYWLRANSRILRGTAPLSRPGPSGPDHTTDLFADEAARFIRNQAAQAQPFFCYLPFNAVHGPLRNADQNTDSARPDWLERYAQRGVAQPRRDYNAVMSHADARIGDLLNELETLGLTECTLVIVHSDNGAMIEKYPGNNGPLRGEKGTTYEGGIRVPAMMQWPGVIPAGWVSAADVAHFDLFATILEAAGLDIPKENGGCELVGVSLLPHLRSAGSERLPDRYLFWDLYGQEAVLHGQWKLVGSIPNHHGDFEQALADVTDATFELYDLDVDPGETSNVAENFPDIYQDLKQRHQSWLRQVAQRSAGSPASP